MTDPAMREREAVVAWIDASISFMAGYPETIKTLNVVKGAILRGEHLEWPQAAHLRGKDTQP